MMKYTIYYLYDDDVNLKMRVSFEGVTIRFLKYLYHLRTSGILCEFQSSGLKCLNTLVTLLNRFHPHVCFAGRPVSERLCEGCHTQLILSPTTQECFVANGIKMEKNV